MLVYLSSILLQKATATSNITDSNLPEHDDDTHAPHVVNFKMAQTALGDVINIFDTNPAHADTLI